LRKVRGNGIGEGVSRLATALANFACHGSIWLVSDHGHVDRFSKEQFLALPRDDERRRWTARLDEDEAKAVAERRRGRVN
jgi:hypothetical protein